MYLLYADESGSINDSGQTYFVLAGIALHEREPHWIEKDMDDIAKRFNADGPEFVEFHASPMRSGNKTWRRFPLAERDQAIKDCLISGVRQRDPKKARLFGVVLKKENHVGRDIAEVAFEQLASRFDMFLTRCHRDGNTQRGLIVFDKASTERRIQTLSREFKYAGHTFGKLRNFCDVPVFVDSEASRLIQLADLIAYALFRNFEHDDSSYYDVIAHCFDREGGVEHGLYVR